MHITTQLTVDDYLAAQRLHFRPKPAIRWVSYALGALFAGMLLQEAIVIAQGGALPRYWWMLPAGLAYGALLFLIVLPWRVGRIFKGQPALAQPTKTVFNEEGLLLETSRGHLRFPWSMLKRWKRNKRYILVYHSAVLFHIFPRRCFENAAQFEALAERLRQNIGPEQS